MSKEQKKLSEHKHRMVHDYLKKHFPDCEVSYNGVEGVDHKIIYNDNTTYVETKTCKRTIGGGIKFTDNGDLYKKFNFGKFKFDNIWKRPYKKSQHQDLVDANGWYILVVGIRIRGAPAKVVDKRIKERIKGTWTLKRFVWDDIVLLTCPAWLDALKDQVHVLKEQVYALKGIR